MKTSRNKKARKNLAFFINNFKFYQPFQILIDGTFALASLENKFNIQDQLPKYFQAETKLLTTACIISETENIGNFTSTVIGAMRIVKQYPVHKCGHEKKMLTGAKCLLTMVGNNNPSRYIIATQDRELQESLRKIPGIPLLYLHGKAPTLEAPSLASRKYAEDMQKGLGLSKWEKENVTVLKKEAGLLEECEQKPKKKRKKGPNPLSCLKKKKKPGPVQVTTEKTNAGKVRKKKKIKIPSHVKEALINELKNEAKSV